jgi:molybdopterin molybdotransferase
VGDKDFTRPLLEWLGFELVFNRVSIRPGAPLIFGVNGRRVAFGLPGNPLSHFVCMHLFVKTALSRLIGAQPGTFASGTLAANLEEPPCPRETFWPARMEAGALSPLRWASSGDLTCLAEANALVRVPANSGPMREGTRVAYWPAIG